MFNNKKTSQSLIESNSNYKTDTTIISASSNFEGTLNSSGIIRVDGNFNGELNVDGNIIVGESGNINATIRANKVTIAGRIEGNVHCNESLELTSGGKLFGDIEVRSITIENGAVFQGKCIMIDCSSVLELPLNSNTKLLSADPIVIE